MSVRIRSWARPTASRCSLSHSAAAISSRPDATFSGLRRSWLTAPVSASSRSFCRSSSRLRARFLGDVLRECEAGDDRPPLVVEGCDVRPERPVVVVELEAPVFPLQGHPVVMQIGFVEGLGVGVAE